MKKLIFLFLVCSFIVGVLIAILYEESRMHYNTMAQYEKNIDCIVLIHGLFRSPTHMSFLEKSFKREGYTVSNLSYPSTEKSLPRIVNENIVPNIPSCKGQLHFVGHSMGGIVIRELLRQYHVKNLGRIVMLGTPNNGSEMIDFSLEIPIIKEVFIALFGPAATQLKTLDNDYLKDLPEPTTQVGVIAGNRFIEPVGGLFVLPKPNDGKVSVESTKLKNMTDHIVLDTSHEWLPIHHQVRTMTIRFIKKGSFR